MIEGKLKCGFEIVVPDENLDDYELFEDLAGIDEDATNAGKVVSVYKRLLGEEQYKALKEHVRGKTGKVKTSDMMEILQEIFELNGDAKN